MAATSPETLTIITTYQCNAACTDCCFECGPTARGRLSLAAMRRQIDAAVAAFPGLRLVVFSGGECFLLKHDLYAAIAHANGLGLRTRCVTNGFWGKTPAQCRQTVRQLVRAGIDEINISTGHDHQQWVPVPSVIRAAQTLVARSIFTLVTVEMDTPDSHCLQQLVGDPDMGRLLRRPALFRLQSNSWMPFREDGRMRRMLTDKRTLDRGCSQLFHNVTLTPQHELAACCGLTMEHIPEMKLGPASTAAANSMLYYGQLEDFLKIWIHVDGPSTIIKRLFGDGAREDLRDVVHICQACAILHQHPEVRARLRRRYREFVPDVMSRFYLRHHIDTGSVPLTSAPGHANPDQEKPL